MNNPYISIIVPVYKVEKYIRNCIESIICQKGDWELILVDDGSPDGCPAICDEYAEKDERVQVIHKKNGGVSTARNAGLDIARGEWIWFVDGDDFISSNKISEFIDRVKKFDWDYIQFGHTRIDEETGEKKIINTKDVIGLDKINFFLIGVLPTHSHCCVWYKHQIIEDHHLRFSDGLRMAEDLEFMYSYQLYATKPVQLDFNLYNYKQRRDSAVHNVNTYRNGINDSFVVLEHWLKRIKEENIVVESWFDNKVNIFVKRMLYYGWHISDLDKIFFQKHLRSVIKNYQNAGFHFPKSMHIRIARFSVTLYFFLNKTYLKLKGLE